VWQLYFSQYSFIPCTGRYFACLASNAGRRASWTAAERLIIRLDAMRLSHVAYSGATVISNLGLFRFVAIFRTPFCYDREHNKTLSDTRQHKKTNFVEWGFALTGYDKRCTLSDNARRWHYEAKQV
jgi:hypothetical protein